MKTKFKFSLLVLMIAAFSIGLSSSIPAPTPDPGGNGVNVEIFKGEVSWYLYSPCADEFIFPESTTHQFKDGVLHMQTSIFQLPKGHCEIPKSTYKDELWPGWTMTVTPGGKIILQEIYN